MRGATGCARLLVGPHRCVQAVDYAVDDLAQAVLELVGINDVFAGDGVCGANGGLNERERGSFFVVARLGAEQSFGDLTQRGSLGNCRDRQQQRRKNDRKEDSKKPPGQAADGRHNPCLSAAGGSRRKVANWMVCPTGWESFELARNHWKREKLRANVI